MIRVGPKTRDQIEDEAADFRERFRAEQARAEDEAKRQAPPGWLLEKWADEKLKGLRR